MVRIAVAPLARAVVVAAAFAGTGCGLISSDVTNFNLDLPEKKFSIDSAGWDIDAQRADAYFNTSCSSSTQCNTAAELACEMDCSGMCNANSRCELNMEVGLHQGVNLVMEKPELQSINDEPVIKVTIDAVTYAITQNTLNVETPELAVYVAPMSIMDPKDSMAKKIGTIAPIAAGATTPTEQQLMFTPDGKAALVAVMNNYKTPFNVIVGSTLTVQPGQPVPAGKLDAVVNIRAHAGL
ncbi:MAG: hypothetical protein H0X17_10090 [Deltaproteobacteria bacterium]|nr:hypothetical protein [Deltaproteobacteria bacterium]